MLGSPRIQVYPHWDICPVLLRMDHAVKQITDLRKRRWRGPQEEGTTQAGAGLGRRSEVPLTRLLTEMWTRRCSRPGREVSSQVL